MRPYPIVEDDWQMMAAGRDLKEQQKTEKLPLYFPPNFLGKCLKFNLLLESG